MLIPCTIVYFSARGFFVRNLFFVIISLSLCVCGRTPARADSSSVQLPPDTVGTRDSDDSVRIIGNLPYSNQWTFERASSFLYMNYDQSTLASQAIHSGHYESDYSASKVSLISLDYFSKF